MNGGLDNADWTTRREIIRAVVKQIEIDEDDVRVLYKVSPDGIASACCGEAASNIQFTLRRSMA